MVITELLEHKIEGDDRSILLILRPVAYPMIVLAITLGVVGFAFYDNAVALVGMVLLLSLSFPCILEPRYNLVPSDLELSTKSSNLVIKRKADNKQYKISLKDKDTKITYNKRTGHIRLYSADNEVLDLRLDDKNYQLFREYIESNTALRIGRNKV